MYGMYTNEKNDNRMPHLQWDMHFYFARRGRENFRIMAKDWFAVRTDPVTNLTYIIKVKDEETKNHKTANEPIMSAFMPEIPGDKYCPVASYLKYTNALSPKSESLWQTLKFTEFPINNKEIWYYGHLGHNKLDSCVADITNAVGLDEHYTNQCLRSTAITLLGRLGYGNKQIMRVSGHKSSTSLKSIKKSTSKKS